MAVDPLFGDAFDEAEELCCDVVESADVALDADALVESVSDDEILLDEPESVVSANATAGVVNTEPIPRKTASTPTRPMNLA